MLPAVLREPFDAITSTLRVVDTARMRRIDARVGAPICTILTWHRRLRTRPAPPTAPRRMAVIKLAEQGATIVAHPALRRAVDMVGRDNLFVVVFDENRFILDELDVVPTEHVLTVSTRSAASVALGMLRTIRRLRREQVDTVIDFEFFSRASAVLAYLSGAGRRVGYHSYFDEGAARGDLMTHRLSFNALGHASQSFMSLVQASGRSPDALPALPVESMGTVAPPAARITPEEIDAARQLVADATGSPVTGPILLLNANTSDLIPLRQWPAVRYVELARRLLDEHPAASVVFTGAPAEAHAAAELAEQVGSDRCGSVAGRTTMRELLALYAASEVMVTNDSGPAHYATLTPIDVVTLFGPESPAVFGAIGPRNHHLWGGLACSPCVNAFNDRQTACRNNLCMQAISVGEVAATVGAALAERATGRST